LVNHNELSGPNKSLYKWSDLYYGLTGHFAPRKFMRFYLPFYITLEGR
jgi:hypothetical protein